MRIYVNVCVCTCVCTYLLVPLNELRNSDNSDAPDDSDGRDGSGDDSPSLSTRHGLTIEGGDQERARRSRRDRRGGESKGEQGDLGVTDGEGRARESKAICYCSTATTALTPLHLNREEMKA